MLDDLSNFVTAIVIGLAISAVHECHSTTGCNQTYHECAPTRGSKLGNTKIRRSSAKDSKKSGDFWPASDA